MIRVSALAVCACILAFPENPAAAQEAGFRIETDVFDDGVAEPLQQSLTLFYNGVGYDVSRDDDSEIVIVKPLESTIVLLNQAHKIRAEVSLDNLSQLIDSARRQAAVHPKLANYLEGARKITTTDDSVTVGNDELSYHATLQRAKQKAQQKAVSDTYRMFADALKQLNSARNGGDAPFARLALNDAINQKHALPEEITLSMKHGRSSIVRRCRLHATWLLSRQDHQRIEAINRDAVNFELVGYAEYQKKVSGERVASRR